VIKIHEYESYFNTGVTLLEDKKYTEARDNFQKAIDIEPKFIHAWIYKGISLEELQQYEEAIKCYSQAIQINPDVADLWYNKGATYCKMKRYQDALTCFDKVLEIEPLNALVKTTRALVIAKPPMIEIPPNKPDKDGNKEGSNSEEVEIYKYRKREIELGGDRLKEIEE
jgi:tetratricopeptide (TPR) repeat protein